MQQHLNEFVIALFELAKEEKKINNYKKQANIIIEVIQSNEKYLDVLDSFNLSKEIKIELITKVFAKKIEKTLLNFMFILINKNKIRFLITILKKLISQINKSINIYEGIVYSVKKLKPKEISDIEKTTSKKLGIKVSLLNKLDEDLISGIKVVVQNQVIDNSISTKIEEFKKNLLKGVVN